MPLMPQENSASNVHLRKFSSQSVALTASLSILRSWLLATTNQSPNRFTNSKRSSAKSTMWVLLLWLFILYFNSFLDNFVDSLFSHADHILSSDRLSAKRITQSSTSATWSSRLSLEAAVNTFRRTKALRLNATWPTFGDRSARSHARTTEF